MRRTLAFLSFSILFMGVNGEKQSPLDVGSSSWSVSISNEYDLLGPFPISAREQQYLSPSYPLRLTVPYAHRNASSFPSALADGGQVHWTSDHTQTPGEYWISYPSIRWGNLRSTLGWSALQHHSVFHTTMIINPPSEGNIAGAVPGLQIGLKQASFVAIVPREGTFGEENIRWLEGDIYAQSTMSRIISLSPHISRHHSSVFDIFLSIDYEIRLFGDPLVSENSDQPVSRVQLFAALVHHEVIVSDPILPDFVDGWAWGDSLGVQFQNSDEWTTVVEVISDQQIITISSEDSASRLAPFQSRLIPFNLSQSSSLPATVTRLSLTFTFSSGLQKSLTIPIIHHPRLDMVKTFASPVKQTHRFPVFSASLLVPPTDPSESSSAPLLLALHGAGVDYSSPWWTQSIPRQKHSWIVYPSGLSFWGYDWRGPSIIDAIAAVESFQHRMLTNEKRVLVIGHSNGGQGTFHLASRHPDFITGAIPFAAYLAAAAYVSYSMSHGSHYVDPSLQGILHASTAGGDNDIFLGNLATKRVRVFHGGADENVPVWQSRKAVDIIKTYNYNADVTFDEIPGKPHWWDGVFTTSSLKRAIDDLLEPPDSSLVRFSLTVMWPHESGSLNGWRIRQTEIPGRLSKLVVDGPAVRTSNIWSFSVATLPASFTIGDTISIDGQEAKLDTDEAWFIKSDDGTWHKTNPFNPPHSGPLSRILAMGSPITIVIPSTRTPRQGTSTNEYLQSLAVRLAHNLLMQLSIDCDIVYDHEAIANQNGLADRPVIVLGGPLENTYSNLTLKIQSFPIQFPSSTSNQFRIWRRLFDESGISLVFMRGTHLYIIGDGTEAYERGIRIFPLRTGVSNPEWIAIGPEADVISTGGILGAGFWSRDGGYSEEMSWLG